MYTVTFKNEETTPGEQQDDHPHLSPHGSPFQAQQQQGDWEQPTRICKRQIIPDKSALCSEMTGSVHMQSTGNAVYLDVCKVFNAVSYCLCLIGGMCSLQDGWEIIWITRLKEKLSILPSLTDVPHGLTTKLLQMSFLRG